ncbi:RNase H type-1 domain-containing protein [Fusarium sp. LHS14.1]|nr:RNase H type-1 domain-containing protein [Fusarium sp. LHS14.1]
MSFIREAIRDLCAKAQDVFSRSERAWIAAREAWNEDSDTQAQNDGAVLTEPQETPESASTRMGRKNKNKTAKAEKGTGKKMRVGSSLDIFIKPPEKAIERALLSDGVSSDSSRLVLWTDASEKCSPSHAPSPAGIAVAFRQKFHWVRVTARLNHFNNIAVAETQAIAYALDYAVHQSAQLGVTLRQVEIFTDSQSALMNLARGTPKIKRKTREEVLKVNKALLESAKKAMDALAAAGIGLELHWVPRGKVKGNMVADEGSRLARLAMVDLVSPDHVMIEVIPNLDDKEALQVPVEETLASARAASAHRRLMAEGIAKMFASQVEPPPIKPLSGKPASIESPAVAHSLIPDAALYPVDLLGMKPVPENQPMPEVQHPAEPEPEPEPEPEREPEKQAPSWAAPQFPSSDRAEGWPDVRDASRS